jgi:hypothetical protein
MRLKSVVVPGVLGSVVDVSSHPASSLLTVGLSSSLLTPPRAPTCGSGSARTC